MQIFMSFYDEQLKQQICYSFILLIPYMFFNPFNICRLVLLDCIKLVQMFFPQNSTGPWPQLQTDRKIPGYDCHHITLLNL